MENEKRSNVLEIIQLCCKMIWFDKNRKYMNENNFRNSVLLNCCAGLEWEP